MGEESESGSGLKQKDVEAMTKLLENVVETSSS